MNESPLEALLEKVCAGDAAAAEEVFRAYEPYLRMVVRRMLPPQLRRKFDSIDVVQSVWADLLHGLRDNAFRFQDVAHLRAFLVRATRNRFLDRVRSNRRAAALERPVELADIQESPLTSTERPSETAQASELWERMLQMCTEAQRPLLELKRQGCSLEDIAAQTGYHPSSIRRVFYNLARQLAAEGTADDAEEGE